MSLRSARVLNAGLIAAVAGLLIVLVGPVRAADPVVLSAPVYINAGGGEYVDGVNGRTWLADAEYDASLGYGYVNFSTAVSSAIGGPGLAIGGTNNDEMYGPAREGMDAYVINLPNGTYDLTLYFAEVDPNITAAGQRRFNVFVEGVPVMTTGLDLRQQVGPQYATTRFLGGVNVTDGQLKMVFTAEIGKSLISGIGITLVQLAPPPGTPTPTPTQGPTPTPTPAPEAILRVNVGGSDYQAADGAQWYGDGPFTTAEGWGYIENGDSLVIDRRTGEGFWMDILNTPDDAIFATARNAIDRYDFNVQGGVYAIDLLFTETDYSVLEGDRLFDVSVQGTKVLDDFDILAAAGAYETAVVRRISPISASSGLITLRLLNASGTTDMTGIPVEHRPEISGIIIWPHDPGPPPPATPTPTPSGGPTATPTPVAPTPTPPSFNGGGGGGSGGGGGGGLFLPLAPTPTPTPTKTPTPTPTPTVAGGGIGGVGGGPTGTDGGTVLGPTPTPPPGNAAFALSSRQEEDGRVAISVTLEGAVPVSGFTIAIDLPLTAFVIDDVKVSSELTTMAFQGLPSVDSDSGQVVLTGGLATPGAFADTPLMTVWLTPRQQAAPGVYEVTFAHGLARNAGSLPMDVELGPDAVAVLALNELADADGDGLVGLTDLQLLSLAYGSVDGDGVFEARVDLNVDGRVDLRDLAILAAGYE